MNRKSSSKQAKDILISLLEKIYAIEEILESLEGAESTYLKSETKEKKERLKSSNDSELFFFRKEIDKIKEKVEALASKQNWLTTLLIALVNTVTKVPTSAWLAISLAIIPLLVAGYTGYLAFVQLKNQPEIRKFAMETAVIQTASAVSTPNIQTAMPSATETLTLASPTATP